MDMLDETKLDRLFASESSHMANFVEIVRAVSEIPKINIEIYKKTGPAILNHLNKPLETSSANNSTTVEDLNMDCWRALLDCLEVPDIARSEDVSRGWRNMVHQYLQEVHGYVLFMPGSVIQIADKKSRVLRVADHRMLVGMLRNIGRDMTRVTTDGDMDWLGAIADHCPNLREVTLYNVRLQSNDELGSLLRRCTKLERVTIRASKWVENHFTLDLNNIKHIEVDRNLRITGFFLRYVPRQQLESLALRECSALDYYHLDDNIEKLSTLTKLSLDDCPGTFNYLHELLKNLPQLEELSLSYYTEGNGRELAGSISRLGNLRKLKVRNNGAVDDGFVETVVEGCRTLESLDIAGCNGNSYNGGVTDAVMPAVASSHLQHLDVSALAGLTDAGLNALVRGSGLQLRTFRVGQNGALSQRTIFGSIKRFRGLQLLDVRGNDSVSRAFVANAATAAGVRDPKLTIIAAATSIHPEDLVGMNLASLVFDLNWPMDEPWERHYHNADDEFEELENYANLDFGQPWRFGN